MNFSYSTTETPTLAGILPGTKILFANAPADGHFNPLTGLAVYLQDQGCDVRWSSSQQYSSKINKLQIPFYPFKRALDWHGDNLEEIFPERAKIGNKIRKLNFDIVNAFRVIGFQVADGIVSIVVGIGLVVNILCVVARVGRIIRYLA